MANLKGNLGVKSSALAPTASKLSTQYLVLDHMTNHYNKIAKAKSAIDNKPPKSLSTSQKIRDRTSRQRALSPQRTRPISRNSLLHSQGDLEDYQDLLNEEPADEEERLAYNIMKSTLGKKSSDSHKATYNSEHPSHVESWGSNQPANTYEQANNFTKTIQPTYERPVSARSARSARSVSLTQRGTRVPIYNADPTKVTYNGDVLEKRAHCFTEPDQPFTPRTLKTSHESRLKSSKCYNAPKNKKPEQNGAVQSVSHSFVSEQTSMGKEQPKPQPRLRTRSGRSEDLGETMPTSQLSETMLMDITLQSRDGRRMQNQNGQVPPLAISMDVDHLNWLQEQASKAQVRARNSGKFKKSLAPQPDSIEQQYAENGDPNGLSNSVRLETLKKEEEQKYLAFAKEVTDDVLATGISSDRVLNKLFENHIERRKGDLDEDRMREVVKDLRKNLGLTMTEQPPIGKEYRKKPHSRSQSNDGASEKSAVKAASSRHSNDVLSETSSIKEQSVKIPDFNNTLAVNGNATLDSTSTMKFGQTGDVFSTIHTEGQGEAESELSDGELTLTRKEEAENVDDLSATQALKQYQMNLTAKEASGDANGEISGSEIEHTGEGHSTQEMLESSERPATGEMRESQDHEELSTTGQITVETSNHELLTSANGINATDTSPGLSSDMTPGSGTQNSDMSPGYSNNSQESNSYSQLMPKTKPRARRRMKAENSSSSEVNDSNILMKERNGSRNGLATMSTGSWSEKESENGDEESRTPSHRRMVKTEQNKRETKSSNKMEKEAHTIDEDNEVDDDYASDYEPESAQDTHRTSDDDF